MLGRSCPQLLGTFTLIATASCFCLSHSLTRAYIYYRYGTKIYEVGASVRVTKGSAASFTTFPFSLLSRLGLPLLSSLSVREGG